MCGRARCTVSPEAVASALGAAPNAWRDGNRFTPTYNALPGAYLPVVCAARSTGATSATPRKGRAPRGASGRGGGMASQEDKPSEEGWSTAQDGVAQELKEGGVDGRDRVVRVMKWGLVPSFASKNDRPDHFKMFNARSESLHEKASFRRLLPTRRCVFPMEGFFEWKKEASKKQPYYIHAKPEAGHERLLLVAGLSDTWQDAEGSVLDTFTIITTAASSRFSWLHDRMPAILPSEAAVAQWLDPSAPVEAARRLLKPYNGDDLVWHPVTPQMGRPSFQGPECVAPLPPAEETTAATSQVAIMFRRRTETKGAAEGPTSTAEAIQATAGVPQGTGREGEEILGRGLKALGSGAAPMRSELEEAAVEHRRVGPGERGGAANPQCISATPEGDGASAAAAAGDTSSRRAFEAPPSFDSAQGLRAGAEASAVDSRFLSQPGAGAAAKGIGAASIGPVAGEPGAEIADRADSGGLAPRAGPGRVPLEPWAGPGRVPLEPWAGPGRVPLEPGAKSGEAHVREGHVREPGAHEGRAAKRRRRETGLGQQDLDEGGQEEGGEECGGIRLQLKGAAPQPGEERMPSEQESGMTCDDAADEQWSDGQGLEEKPREVAGTRAFETKGGGGQRTTHKAGPRSQTKTGKGRGVAPKCKPKTAAKGKSAGQTTVLHFFAKVKGEGRP